MQQEKQNNISNKILQYTLKKSLWGSSYTLRKTIANTCLSIVRINTFLCIGIIMNFICVILTDLFVYFVYIYIYVTSTI